MIIVFSSSAPSSSRVAPPPDLCSDGTARQRALHKYEQSSNPIQVTLTPTLTLTHLILSRIARALLICEHLCVPLSVPLLLARPLVLKCSGVQVRCTQKLRGELETLITQTPEGPTRAMFVAQRELVEPCLTWNLGDRPTALDLLLHPTILEVPSLRLLSAFAIEADKSALLSTSLNECSLC